MNAENMGLSQRGQAQDLTPVQGQDQLEGKLQDRQEFSGYRKIIIINIASYLTVLYVTLNNTIITTTIPQITDEFKALDDVGWYGSTYLLTTCAFQLLYGKFYSTFSVKWTFLIALALFEIGSLLCGAAPISAVLIIGRALTGLGSAGIFSGAQIIVTLTVPVEIRSIFTDLMNGTYGIASIAGPLLGGAFTDHISWRWCFYINLPLGAGTCVIILLFFKVPPRGPSPSAGCGRRFLQFDPIGTILFVPSIICLLLALQWGGTTYPWNSGRIICLLVVFSVCFLAFVAVQCWLGDDATVPPWLVAYRTVSFSALFGFCMGGAFFTLIYYLPIWFQAVHGVSPMRSGIDNIPLIMSQVLATVGSGFLTIVIGHYMPFIYASSILMAVGAGLLTTFLVSTSSGAWIGYQIIFGLGAGCEFQQPLLAASTVLPPKDIPAGMTAILFFQMLGGTIMVSIGQNLFSNKLPRGLSAIPGVDAQAMVQAGVAGLKSLQPGSQLQQALVAYNAALTRAFEVSMIMACLSTMGALGMEWKSTKPPKDTLAEDTENVTMEKAS